MVPRLLPAAQLLDLLQQVEARVVIASDEYRAGRGRVHPRTYGCMREQTAARSWCFTATYSTVCRAGRACKAAVQATGEAAVQATGEAQLVQDEGAHRAVLVAQEARRSRIIGEVVHAQVGVHGPAAGQLAAATLRDDANEARSMSTIARGLQVVQAVSAVRRVPFAAALRRSRHAIAPQHCSDGTL